MELCKFKSSLVYKANSRIARAVPQRNPISKKNKTKQTKKLMLEASLGYTGNS